MAQIYHIAIGIPYMDGLVQERRNSSALAMELRLFCNNPSVLEWHLEQCVYKLAYVANHNINKYGYK